MYQPVESVSQQVSKDQVKIVLDNGKTVGTYFWIYRDVNPADSAKWAVDLARQCNIKIPIMLGDFESYEGTMPTPSQVYTAMEAVEKEGEKAGVYTGKWVMDRYPGDTRLSRWPLWDGALHLPATIELDEPYAGWTTCIGRQFTSQPCDQSVYREEFT